MFCSSPPGMGVANPSISASARRSPSRFRYKLQRAESEAGFFVSQAALLLGTSIRQATVDGVRNREHYFSEVGLFWIAISDFSRIAA